MAVAVGLSGCASGVGSDRKCWSRRHRCRRLFDRGRRRRRGRFLTYVIHFGRKAGAWARPVTSRTRRTSSRRVSRARQSISSPDSDQPGRAPDLRATRRQRQYLCGAGGVRCHVDRCVPVLRRPRPYTWRRRIARRRAGRCEGRIRPRRSPDDARIVGEYRRSPSSRADALRSVSNTTSARLRTRRCIAATIAGGI